MLDVGRRRRTVSSLATAVALVALALVAPVCALAQVAPVAGQNVNMVSGTGWPTGDPFLQRQNEPSIAVSTRNPAHLLAGANDYRAVDIPNADGDEVGDAWLGVFKSFDGGQTWQSTLLPGYPQDTSAVGTASPIKGYKAAADPVIRAGTDGLFYYSGITFNRGTNLGQVFVSRFIDLNNRENGDATSATPTDPIKYVDTAVIDSGTSGQFLDKPWLAVDVPRGGGASCKIPVSPTQTVAAGNVYLAYAKFTGSNSSSSQVLFVRSLDCGKTWSKPIKLSPNDKKNQGTSVAIDPATGAIYVGYRRFETNGNNPDAIVVVRSTDFGKSFSAGVDAALVEPFDQNPTTPTRFRTASLPVIAVSVVGDPSSTASLRRVHVAWAERDAPLGEARIVVKTSLDGVSWPPDSAKLKVDDDPLGDDLCPGCYTDGHQFMPSLTFTEGRLMVLYYDQRLDQTLGRLKPNNPFEPSTTAPNVGSFFTTKREFLGDQGWFTPTIDDSGLTRIRHLLDLRVAEAVLPSDPAAPWSFTSAAVSQYKYGTLPGSSSAQTAAELDLDQLEVNPPNLPMFSKGTLPFIGDYIEIAGLSFVPTANGWQFNTGWNPSGQAATAPFHYAVWTSNQDVVPPPDGNWASYTPPTLPAALLAQLGPNSLVNGLPRPTCSVPAGQANGWAGTRNQNIYFSRITEGLGVWSPQNAKLLNNDRAFVVIVQNATLAKKTVVLGLPDRTSVPASFERNAATTAIWAEIAPLSSIARSVFVTANANPTASFRVNVDETADGTCGPDLDTSGCVRQGASTAVQLNAQGAFGATLADPSGTGALGPESYTVSLSSAAVTSPNLAAVTSAAVTSAAVTSAAVTSAAVTSQALAAPQLAAVTSAAVTSAAVTSYNVSDAAVTSAAVTSAAVTSAAVTSAAVTSGNILAAVTSAPLSDANYTLKNVGNTTHSYHVKLVGKLATCPTASGGTTTCPVQLILSKPYGSPYANGCELAQDYRPVAVANVDDVSSAVVSDPGQVTDPDIPDPQTTNATITLGPGETGVITIRGPLELQSMQTLSSSLVPVVVPHAGGAYAAPLFIPEGQVLPPMLVGAPYSAALQAIGGTGTYSWSPIPISGALPAGLSLSSNGLISGTPTGVGTTSATLQVSDGNTTATQTITFTVSQGTTALALTATPSPAVFGQTVTLTATVTPASPAATGTVEFRDGASTLGTATLGASGVARLTTAALSVSSHSLTASYGGDSNYLGSSTPSAFSLTVNAANTSVQLGSSVNPALVGQPVTFTVKVSAVSPGTGIPTGTVTLQDGAATLTPVPLSLDATGSATYTTTTPPLAAGTHPIVALYGGSASFLGSASATLSQVVAPAATATTLGSTPNPSNYGQSVTFTAQVSVVSPGTGVPTGTVTFKDGATALGTAALNASGVASYATAGLAAGVHSITAAYSGAAAFAVSTSASLSQSVNTLATTTTLTSSANPSLLAKSVTFTAKVTAASGTPTGTVTFKDGATVLGSVALGATGTATYSTSSLTAGTHSITATYSGDTSFAGSSASLSQSVNYVFAGFANPLTTAGTLSAPSFSGSWSFSRVLPVKWQLTNGNGANITDLASTASLTATFAGATCPGVLTGTTAILYTPTQGAAGGSTFRSGSSGFIFNWDATKNATTGCWWIRLKLNDGSAEKVTAVQMN